MDKLVKNKNGFSLVELVIVMAIISIMTAVGLVSLQSSRTATQLEASGREVAAAIREAQNNALTGKNANSTGTICQVYNFVYTTSPDQYITNCSGNYQNAHLLKNGVEFFSGGQISFNIPSGSATLVNPSNPPSNTIQQIRLDKGTSTSHYYICVNRSGSISEQSGLCF